MKAHALRLGPGEDLRLALEAFTRERGLRAACVASCVGSLGTAQIRFAGEPEARAVAGPLEILCVSGTLSPGGAHLHIGVADATGRTTGGHLASGSIVHTTAEVVVLELDDLRFGREPDPATGYRELTVAPER